jgi:hypothetical protein
MGWSRDSNMPHIKADTLKDGFAYEICARRANVGIWVESRRSFVIPRSKFGNTYLFEEVHWDLSGFFGTAKPVMELEKAPFNVSEYNLSDRQILNYLISLDKRIKAGKYMYDGLMKQNFFCKWDCDEEEQSKDKN